MEEVRCAAHLFEYDEDQALPMKPFFSEYKHSFPMLAVIIDGYYGDTKFDCFDNDQVIRIHGYTSQPRVICTDRKSANATDETYYTLPLNTELGFRKVKGHISEGEVQTLSAIVKESQLPVLVKLETKSVRVGTGKHNSDELGNLLVQQKYFEHYLWVNCIDTKALKMNSTTCLLALSNKLTATPITGFKFKPMNDFKAFLAKLDHQVKTSGEPFDETRGNPAFSCYDIHEDTFIYGNNDFSLIKTKPTSSADTRKPEPPPRPIQEDDDDSPGDYEEMEEVPELPPRRVKTSDAASAPAVDTKHKNPLTGILKKIGKHLPKDKSPRNDGNHDDRPPVPSKPRIVEPRNLLCKFKKPSKPYENTEVPKQAIVKPMSSRGDWSPQPLPTPEQEEDDDNIYTPMFDGEGYIEGAVDDDNDDDDIYLVSEDCYVDSELADIAKEQVKPTNAFESEKLVHVTNETPSTTDSREQLQDEQKQLDVASLTIDEVSEALKKLGLDKYVETFKDEKIDGGLLADLSVDDFITELDMRKLEALRLSRYIKSGHIPK